MHVYFTHSIAKYEKKKTKNSGSKGREFEVSSEETAEQSEGVVVFIL
jgi:hypothetical protein